MSFDFFDMRKSREVERQVGKVRRSINVSILSRRRRISSHHASIELLVGFLSVTYRGRALGRRRTELHMIDRWQHRGPGIRTRQYQ